MFRELVLVALCAVVYLVNDVQGNYELEYNPKKIGKFSCPDGYKRFDLDYKSYYHWTFMVSQSTKDAPICALKGVKSSKCKKPNGKKKTWMTFAYGWGEFHVHKYDHFSDIYSTDSSSWSPSSSSSKSSSSSSLIPQYFIIKAFYFKIRGADKVTLMFVGEISKTIEIGGRALDWRKKTWVCIKWYDSPVFSSIWITIEFDRYRKAKLWEMYAVACCEMLDWTITIGKK